MNNAIISTRLTLPEAPRIQVADEEVDLVVLLSREVINYAEIGTEEPGVVST